MPLPATPASRSRQGYRLQIHNEKSRIRQMFAGEAEYDVTVLSRVVAKMREALDHCYELDEKYQHELDGRDGVGEDDLVADAVNAARHNSDVMEYILEIKEKINELQEMHARASPPDQNPHPGGLNVSSYSQTRSHMNIKLPKLDAPKFSGDILEFPTFWALFRASIHDNPDLTDTQKFTYLMRSLSDKARSAISGLDISDAAYAQAIELLQERFDNPERAKFKHFLKLFQIPPIEKSQDSRRDLPELRKVYDNCEKHIRSLIALGVDEGTFSIVFAPILLSKLPSDVITLLSQKNGRDEWKLENVRKWLKDEIFARELSDTLTVESKFEDRRKVFDRPKRSDYRGGSASLLLADARNSRPKPFSKCVFCKREGHFSDQCKQCPNYDTRRNVLQKEGRCLRCLSTGHSLQSCTSLMKCVHCQRNDHHRSMCKLILNASATPNRINHTDYAPRSSGQNSAMEFRRTNDRQGGSKGTQLNVDAQEFFPPGAEVVNVAQECGIPDAGALFSFLPTALTTLHNEHQNIAMKGRILMDTASSRSFITESLHRQLRLPVIGESSVSVGRFGSDKRMTVKTKKVRLAVQCLDGTKVTIVAHVTPTISVPVGHVCLDPARYPIVHQLRLAEPLDNAQKSLPLDVLVGSDFYYKFVTGETNTILSTDERGPVFVGSKLGFLMAGSMPIEHGMEEENTLTILLTEAIPGRKDAMDELDLERFWKLEEVGTKSRSVGDTEICDEKALENFYKTLKFENGRYQVTWPYKMQNPALPDNRTLAMARLKSTFSRLQKSQELLEAYDGIIQNQIQLGIVEVAPEVPTGLVYYVPHHEVITPTKTTTKIRVVYDASSKTRKDSLSLNDCLHRGKVILEDLCGLLIRFRTKRYGIVADIEKAFLQIGLQESERDVARFFWVKDINRPLTPSNVVVYRFTRVYFGAIASPSLLGLTLDAHARKVETTSTNEMTRKIAKTFRQDIYSDNHVSGEDDALVATKHYRVTKDLCRDASMNLREFYTNCKELRKVMNPNDRGEADVTKVLGVTWNVKSDTLQCCGLKKPKISENATTKRIIVREVAQIFDPCGFAAPVTMLGKQLIQELWESGISWDQVVPKDINVRWEKVRSALEEIPTLELRRYIGKLNALHELHVFCDASLKAAAAVVYWRTDANGTVDCNLVCSKTRLAPLKPPQTIPRLELVAMVLGVSLIQFVESHMQLQIVRKVVWTDSQCVLAWLENDRVTTKFVKSRIDEIRAVKNLEYRFVAGTENPADLPSRGCSVTTLRDCNTWWKGPSWLSQSDAFWPEKQWNRVESEPLRAEELKETTLAMVTVDRNPIIKLENFSSLTRAIRRTAYVLRAVTNFRAGPGNRTVGRLQTRELSLARQMLEKRTQEDAFFELLESKDLKKTVRKLSLSPLDIKKDADGILRCNSRLEYANLPYDTKYPVLLPKCHAFTDLVIRQAHENSLHAGASQTMVQVRKRYWILRGLNTVKKFVRESCQRCRRVEGGPYAIPTPPALPFIRVTEKTPFAYTGLDYLGPLLVKVKSAGDSYVSKKVWICLFTCALTRAVHLEVVENQTAHEFHLAMRRFMAVYGPPMVIVSDNATQFKAVEEAIKILQADARDTGRMDTDWRKITEAAPWMGGFFERMVGIVKKFLKKTLDCVAATISEMRTVVAEIAFVVNSRPLLYVADDVTSYPLSPNDFLGKFRRSGFPTFAEAPLPNPRSTVDKLVENWKRLQALSSQFWSLWRQAYLTSLREKHANMHQRNPSSLLPSVGSVVQIKDDNLPRGRWRLGKVKELIRSHDGKVRSVHLQIGNGRTGKTITRPLRLLYPLEMGNPADFTPRPPTPDVDPDATLPYFDPQDAPVDDLDATLPYFANSESDEVESELSLNDVRVRNRLWQLRNGSDDGQSPLDPPISGPGGSDTE